MAETPRTARAGGIGGRGLCYLALVIGGLLAFVAAAQPWWTATPAGAEGLRVDFSGAESTGGLAQVLASVVAAGTLLTLVLRSRGRRVLGVALGLVGLGMLVTGVLRTSPTPAAVAARVQLVTLGDEASLRAGSWPFAYAVAGFLVALGAGLLVARAHTWQRRPDRFRRSPVSAAQASANLEAEDPVTLWQALDAGVDPTESDQAPGASERDPDVHNQDARPTMGEAAGTTAADAQGPNGKRPGQRTPGPTPDR